MKIYFHIEYRTVFGEELVLNVVSKDKLGRPKTVSYRMTTGDGIFWTFCLGGKPETQRQTLDYYYSVECEGRTKRHEWLAVAHRLELSKPELPTEQNFYVYDRWIDLPEDSYLYSSAFTECGCRHTGNAREKQPLEATTHPRLRFVVRAPQLRTGQRLAIVGESEVLGAWNPCEAVEMAQQNVNEWAVEFDVMLLSKHREEFKFLAVADNADPLWETGKNRVVAIPTYLRAGDVLVYELERATFPVENERLAGTLVPVFSLRTKGSFGVGDFGDLQRMVDWVSHTRQRLLQVLPINDTTSTHTWADSYPYACISVFALHPQYADLRQLPDIKDGSLRRKFDKLRKELNALPQIDYERVNRSKTEYLRIIFEQEKGKVLKSDEFKAFFRETEHWLVPYAQYCLLRDQTETAEFYYYVQFVLDKQMQAVHAYARQKGVILKGDIPIGVSRAGCDVWMEPRYFNLDGQAGAPPDDFSADGQNWGFPTYNWDEMLKDGCAWWVRRLQHMSRYFDAYRIDHVLGFFRIWEIPVPHKSGLEGQFSPALGLSVEEINSWGVHSEIDNLFLIDHKNPGKLHPRIAVQAAEAYKRLPEWEKNAFNRLYDDYFYRRNNQFWYGEAMKKLPRLVEATRMLVCAEDLGMVPDCVRWVMDELRILSLELQSMPKEPNMRFGELERNPYRSVCTISTHDTPTLRMWWDEDRERAQAYFNDVLGRDGIAPHPMPGWLARDIIAAHLASPSMVCVIALQDWLAIDEHLRLKDANAERVNIPANPKHYWRYRMHLNIEDLIACEGFTMSVKQLVLRPQI